MYATASASESVACPQSASTLGVVGRACIYCEVVGPGMNQLVGPLDMISFGLGAATGQDAQRRSWLEEPASALPGVSSRLISACATLPISLIDRADVSPMSTTWAQLKSTSQPKIHTSLYNPSRLPLHCSPLPDAPPHLGGQPQ
jgi:hypothetical protein